MKVFLIASVCAVGAGNEPGKLLDPRKKMVERFVHFGDTPNVRCDNCLLRLLGPDLSP